MAMACRSRHSMPGSSGCSDWKLRMAKGDRRSSATVSLHSIDCRNNNTANSNLLVHTMLWNDTSDICCWSISSFLFDTEREDSFDQVEQGFQHLSLFRPHTPGLTSYIHFIHRLSLSLTLGPQVILEDLWMVSVDMAHCKVVFTVLAESYLSMSHLLLLTSLSWASQKLLSANTVCTQFWDTFPILISTPFYIIQTEFSQNINPFSLSPPYSSTCPLHNFKGS